MHCFVTARIWVSHVFAYDDVGLSKISTFFGKAASIHNHPINFTVIITAYLICLSLVSILSPIAVL